MPEEKNERTNADLQWEEFSVLENERTDVSIPDEDKPDELEGGGGIASRRFTPKLTDAQTCDKRLFPDLGKEWLNNLLVSRVFPDLYNDLFEIIVKDLLIENNDMSMGEAIATAEVALSIPIDGEGRIDEIQVFSGVVNQTSEDKSKLI